MAKVSCRGPLGNASRFQSRCLNLLHLLLNKENFTSEMMMMMMMMMWTVMIVEGVMMVMIKMILIMKMMML